MNGKRARRVRRALGYKKTPSQLVERGGLREKDGRLYFAQATNNAANQYRWWKRGVASDFLTPELVNLLGHRQATHPLIDQDDLNNGEGNE